jgi:hypothetical protein
MEIAARKPAAQHNPCTHFVMTKSPKGMPFPSAPSPTFPKLATLSNQTMT